MIENAFSLERGVTIQLINQGFISSLIDRQSNGLSGEQVAAILTDTKEALEGIFAFVKSEQPLTTSYIRQLHQQLMKNVETYDVYWPDPVTHQPVLSKKMLERGRYKTEPNNPWRPDGSIHEYCPPLEVGSQMERLVRLFAELDSATVAPEVRSAWLHHAFAQIHPFQDGNGRVARALASLVLIKSGLPPLIVSRYMKSRYIGSLEAADAGEPAALIAFFESCLYRQMVSYWRELRFEDESPMTDPGVSADSSVSEILKSVEARLRAQRKSTPPQWAYANKVLTSLVTVTDRILGNLASEITNTFGRFDSNNISNASSTHTMGSTALVSSIEHWNDGPTDRHEFQVCTLTIKTLQEERILVVLDPLNAMLKGLCAAALVLDRGGIIPIEPSFFFNFADPNPEPRFTEWLNTALKLAILEWQKRIP
ncbi:MAG TPA: Fic family protein [Bryobacteraceae bacterium]